MAKRRGALCGRVAGLLIVAACFSGCSVFFDDTNLREGSPDEGSAGSQTVGKGASSGAGGAGSASGTSGSGGSGASGGRSGSGGGGTGGGGGSSGGQSGMGGMGGSGDLSECDQADPNESNDDFAQATALPDPDDDDVLTPCENNAGPVQGTFDVADDDWFAASGGTNVNNCTAKPAPYAYVLGTSAAEVCYYLRADNAVSIACTSSFEPAADAPEGFFGCCGPSETGLDYEGPDTEILIRVHAATAADACVEYELFYQY